MKHFYKSSLSVIIQFYRKFIKVLLLISVFAWGCDDDDNSGFEDDPLAIIEVPDGFKIEKVVEGLTYPTSIAWDDEGNMFVAEAGGGLQPEQLAPSRILQVTDGQTTEVVNLSTSNIEPALVGLTWHDDAFYVTHRASDLTGAVSRVTKDGEVTTIIDGILDNQAEHQINGIGVGPDGMMYVAVGPAGNAGVVGPSVIPWVLASPNVHARPCQDIVLLGKNFKTADFRTEATDDSVLTGAFVPFGTETAPGQVIAGVNKCGGSILKFDPNNPANIVTHAWGFRNLIGFAWNDQGDMFASENGYDVRGSRPINDDMDATLRITEGTWYGVPDFSASREPLTEDKYESPDSLQAEIFIDGSSVGKDLGFLIDHQASNLTPPDQSLVLGSHEINASPCLMDVAPSGWGDLSGHVFVAEWGDLSPPTNPLRGTTPTQGFRVARIDPQSGTVASFVANNGGGPASLSNPPGSGIERPFDVKFGPDGDMYIVDYGVVEIDMSLAPPYDYKAGTGVIWKVSIEN